MKGQLDVAVASTIAFNLRKARNKKKLSQKEVADLSGVNRVSYSKFETGKRIPTIQNLVKIANTLNVTVDKLLDGVLEEIKGEDE